jgi:hypothetical protein
MARLLRLAFASSRCGILPHSIGKSGKMPLLLTPLCGRSHSRFR